MKRFVKDILWLTVIHASALLVFSFFRLVEFISLNGLIAHADADVLPAFVRGVWFDNVIACYIMALPLVVMLVFGCVRPLAPCVSVAERWLRRGVTVWFAVWYAVAFMPSAANTPYFAYFFKNINSSIFSWFGYTATTAGMLFEEKGYWLYISLYFVFTAMFVWWLFRLERCFCTETGNGTAGGDGNVAANRIAMFRGMVARVALSAMLLSLCFLGIRGRTGYNPIKVSEAYYCSDSFLNQLGINPAFNLLTSALDDMRKENKELSLMPYGEAVTYARDWYGIGGRVDSSNVMRRMVVNDSLHAEPQVKPNVVIILMESMSASLMGEFGHKLRLTPTLDSLYSHSLAFTNFYSAGIHTNHGMTATLYSFPALMFRNLMKGTVTPRRDGIPTVLKKIGYENMFFMTHEAQYDNMKAFFSTNGYDDIYSQEDYPSDSVVNSFGVSDHFVLNYALGKINEKAKGNAPFMATVLTISNHPPYVIPSWFKPRTKEKETQIVEYADWAIGDFLRKAAREPWFANTIFVIQADHGKMVGKSDAELPVSYNHIPLIMFGKGVDNRKYTGMGTQVDVMPTLLGLMGVNYEYDGFGIDLLRRNRDMVFYSADNQIVARDSTHCFIHEPNTGKSFMYGVSGDGKLSEAADNAVFSRLRRYVFSMEQTAQFMLNKQR